MDASVAASHAGDVQTIPLEAWPLRGALDQDVTDTQPCPRSRGTDRCRRSRRPVHGGSSASGRASSCSGVVAARSEPTRRSSTWTTSIATSSTPKLQVRRSSAPSPSTGSGRTRLPTARGGTGSSHKADHASAASNVGSRQLRDLRVQRPHRPWRRVGHGGELIDGSACDAPLNACAPERRLRQHLLARTGDVDPRCGRADAARVRARVRQRRDARDRRSRASGSGPPALAYASFATDPVDGRSCPSAHTRRHISSSDVASWKLDQASGCESRPGNRRRAR